MSRKTFEEVELAVARLGARAAMNGEPFSETLFTYSSDLAARYRLIYELSYLFEKESNMLLHSTEFKSKGRISEFNDSTGWGIVKFKHNDDDRACRFSYKEMDEQMWGETDETVEVTYKFTDSGLIVTKIGLLKNSLG